MRRIIALASLLILAGCGMFSTRSPEAPDTTRHTWITPRVPNDVLDNLRTAIFERDVDNYMSAFDAQSFVYEADAVALAHDPGLADWSYDNESRYITRLFSDATVPVDSILVAVFGTPDEQVIGNEATVRVHYDITAGAVAAGVPHRVAGTAEFHMHIGHDQYWQVYRWVDSRTDNENTWSDLKASL